MRKILGMDIIITKGYPKMQCSSEFARLQKPELVAETNAWMASFFGYENLLKDGEVRQHNKTLIMNQNTFSYIQKNQKDLFFPHSIQKL